MSWRFAWTPKWIVRHVLVVILVVTMVVLGFWQLRRLDEKRDYKALVEARQEQPAVEVSDLIPAAGVGDDPVAIEAVLYRRVRATGTYAADDTVVVENRTYNSAPGAWVLTPLLLDDGSAVVVNRGFIGFDQQGRIVAPVPPTGRVTVEGLVFPSQERGRFGPTDPDDGRLDVLARVDLGRLAAQVGYDLRPAYVQLVSSDPAEPASSGEAALVALGPPEPDEGPHLGYAVQWFIFASIAGGGYLLLLRKMALEEGRASRTTSAA
ncbi:MAG: SURF1 family protein [Acidimicrobiales bacterium]